MMAGYIAAALPARIVRVADTTLFHVAAAELGDALLWPLIARLNGIIDPWIVGYREVKIPPLIDQSATPTGLLEV